MLQMISVIHLQLEISDSALISSLRGEMLSDVFSRIIYKGSTDRVDQTVPS
jgi:hypothetical protein